MLPSELIAHEKNWIKGTYARNAKGESVTPNDASAISWCIFGALFKCNYDDSCEAIFRIKEKLGMSITHFNDNPKTTHADVIKALKSVGL